MKRNAYRLLVALFLSAGCYAGSEAWYRLSKGDANHFGQRKVVARLNGAINEVQRKPLKRVIWENVTLNEDLFAGEAIRTNANSEARLFFVKSGTTIQLEPDSLVVLEENENGLSLDFLQGNLLVQGGGDGAAGAGDGLTLKTGAGEIKLKSAEMSLSKDKTGQVNLEVFRGQAELQHGQQKVALDKDKAAVLSNQGLSVARDRLQLLYPGPGDTILLNLVRGEKLDITWQPLPPGYKVHVEAGRKRSAMSRVAGSTVDGEAGKVAVDQGAGKWFLRLVAESADPNLPPLTSASVPFVVEAKMPPSLLEPAKNADLLRHDKNEKIVFRWANRHKFSAQVLQVASDPMFRKIVHRADLDSDANFAEAALPDGAYHWRMTGFLRVKDKPEALSSPASTFKVVSNWDLKPATLIHPAAGHSVPFMDVQTKGVALKWQGSPGAERFKVVVTRTTDSGIKEIVNQETGSSFLKLSDLKPGPYQWRVVTLDPRGGEPKNSETREFTVDELPKLEWAQGGEDYEYSTPTPSLRARWQALSTPPANYRYRVTRDGEPFDEESWRTTRQTGFETAVAEDGRYAAVVQALNAKGDPIAATEVKVFTVKGRPLLPPPRWLTDTPDMLKSDPKGNLTFGWQEVDGAKHYLMILEDGEGQVVEQRRVGRGTASIKRMKPGSYQVKLKAVDEFDRPGTVGEAKKLEVPQSSDIRAPKIRTMKVK